MPNEELENEVEAINSIYGDGTLVLDSGDVFVLDLPDSRGSLRLNFPPDYPEAPPTILGTQSSGEHKGDAARLLQAFRSTVGRLFIPGEVCLFAVVEEFVSPVESHETTASDVLDEASDDVMSSVESTHLVPQAQAQWIISDPVKENTSVFIAHAARVSSVQEAEAFLEHLLATDKKVAKASHNMTAWRIKGANGVTFQDCDDDGESAAGGRLLHLMQLMEVWNAMVVVSRWFDGTHIGADRFRLINIVARDAFVKGDFITDPISNTKKKNRK